MHVSWVILSLVVQLVDCDGKPHPPSVWGKNCPSFCAGEKILPFSSSSLTLKKKEKMSLPETEIHSEMVAIEAT